VTRAATPSFIGCNKTDSNPPPASGKPGTPTATTGPELFQQHCAKCHPTPGQSARKRGKGPDLVKSAADPEHTPEWIAAHIRDPKIHSPESRMPAFESTLSAADIRTLAEYIKTLK
jgi:mono/diheme cytochrome c family protein